jgi:hypothetical protein
MSRRRAGFFFASSAIVIFFTHKTVYLLKKLKDCSRWGEFMSDIKNVIKLFVKNGNYIA